MSKSTDSDLYGDIYADELLDDLEDSPPLNDSPGDSTSNKSDDRDPSASPSQPADNNNDDAQLSYSAQIAQQFSSYKQTPSQERQQRAGQHAAARTTTPAGSSADSIFGKKPSEMHDAGKMFIGGLSWDTTDEGLRDYFEQFGKVDACTIMRDTTTNISRGFAFLTFEDPNCVDIVLKQSHTLDGKTIDPKRAIPREEHLRNTRFFVGGLAPVTTPESMRAFFSSYGKVVDATVMMDKETGRSKGFGFITFEDVGDSLNHIVGKVGLKVDDKEIEIRLAQARNQREQTRNLVHKIHNNREATPDQGMPQANAGVGMHGLANLGPMAAMFFNRPMNNFTGMNNGMPLMGMNPMMGMGMNMNMNGVAGNPMSAMAGMPNMNMMLMGGGMNGMAANPMNSMGAMRMGMGMMGMGPMQAQVMNRPTGNGMAKPGMQSSLGPSRTQGAVRKQHGFHPYSR